MVERYISQHYISRSHANSECCNTCQRVLMVTTSKYVNSFQSKATPNEDKTIATIYSHIIIQRKRETRSTNRVNLKFSLDLITSECIDWPRLASYIVAYPEMLLEDSTVGSDVHSQFWKRDFGRISSKKAPTLFLGLVYPSQPRTCLEVVVRKREKAHALDLARRAIQRQLKGKIYLLIASVEFGSDRHCPSKFSAVQAQKQHPKSSSVSWPFFVLTLSTPLLWFRLSQQAWLVEAAVGRPRDAS